MPELAHSRNSASSHLDDHTPWHLIEFLTEYGRHAVSPSLSLCCTPSNDDKCGKLDRVLRSFSFFFLLPFSSLLFGFECHVLMIMSPRPFVFVRARAASLFVRLSFVCVCVRARVRYPLSTRFPRFSFLMSLSSPLPASPSLGTSSTQSLHHEKERIGDWFLRSVVNRHVGHEILRADVKSQGKQVEPQAHLRLISTLSFRSVLRIA